MREVSVNEIELFNAAAKLSTAERVQFLDLACKDNPELRRQIDELLQAHFDTGTFLHEPGGKPTGRELPVTMAHSTAWEHPGTIIAGRYKLLEAIGEGGMGSVWVAEQSQPVKRKVAVKLIKAGMDSKTVLARFEAERQALAVMDHPNIAKVLDGGLTEQGRPYFVMEYVRGIPITEYCDAAKMGVSARLHLFTQVCHAVQHAHQKGIIHRDLKPSNILVAPYDDKPVPKVIDFGLAKAIHQSLTEHTLHTAHDMVLGTPLYMSPEQAQLNNIDIDTRSDVYSLGVLLYELLTGSTPLEKQRFKQAAWDEMRRMIREEDPPRPSQRLSSVETLPSVAASRHIEPARLTRLVRGELDWIVMKALEKDRTRRYETANGFAADVLRYLSGEPVLAAPPSAMYRIQKFVRRNTGNVIAASLLLLALVGGIVGTTVGLLEAKKQERAALAAQKAETVRAEAERLARLDAQASEKLASERLVQVEAEKKRANDEKQIAEAVKDFLQNKLLAQASTRTQANALLQAGEQTTEAKLNPTIRELLDRAAKELAPEMIETNFSKQPLVQAAILHTVGTAYRNIGEANMAIEFLIRSAGLFGQHQGSDHPDTLTSMNDLALSYGDAGQLDMALPLFAEVLVLRKAKLGADHPHTLTSMSNLALAYRDDGDLGKALPLLEQTLTLRTANLGPNHADTVISMHNLATVYRDVGELGKALPLLEQTLPLMKAKFGLDHPDTLNGMNALAAACLDAGQPEKAVGLLEQTFALRMAKLGPDHPHTFTSMNNLAVAYGAAGMLDKTLTLLAETLMHLKAKLGDDHPRVLIIMNNLAATYVNAGELEKGLSLLEESRTLTIAKHGPDHPDSLRSMSNLAMAYREAGKLDLALPLFEQTLSLRNAKLGPDHLDTLSSMHNLASAYQAASQLDKALPLFEETLRLRMAKHGPDHLDTLVSMGRLAACYWSLKRLDKSIPLFEQLLELYEKKFGRDHLETQRTVANLGVNYKDANRLAEAIPLLEEAHRASPQKPALRWVGQVLLDGYTQQGEQNAKVTDLIREQLSEARQSLPKDSPQLAGRLASLGRTQIQLKQWNEAESLFRECLAIRQNTLPEHWVSFNTQSLLGEVLLGQRKFAEAEPLLLQGYEGMKARQHTIPALGIIRISETRERLVELYTDWHAAQPDQGYDAQAALWRQIRD
jgi:eukaryotic-like serine/threonine-protein kinase